jgi:hypothetical protein
MSAPQRHFDNSDELCRYVSQMSDNVCILGFSTGKDALGAWVQLLRFFKRIIPVYLYGVPDLEFVEHSLRYYEDFFKTEIIRYPHPSLVRWLNNFTFQAPEHIEIIRAADLQSFDYADVTRAIQLAYGLPAHILAANGVRMADSINRRTAIIKYGSITPSKLVFYPVYDWNKARLVSELRQAKVKLPVDYKWFGRTFDGLDLRFIREIKEHSPRDYRRILEMFPMAGLEMMRRRQLERLNAYQG